VWGPLPAETFARLVALGERALFVRGNADREVAAGATDGLAPDVAELTRWAHDQLGPPQREWLARLPLTVTLDVDGLGETLFCHASPRRDDEAIGTATPEDDVAEMLAAVSERTVVCGHTHAAFDRRVARRRVVNPGSVGLPVGAPGAPWALLGPGVTLRRSDYDVAAAGEAFRRKGGPGAEAFAEHVLAPPPAGPGG
jgi:predicted phosphodiesterase